MIARDRRARRTAARRAFGVLAAVAVLLLATAPAAGRTGAPVPPAPGQPARLPPAAVDPAARAAVRDGPATFLVRLQAPDAWADGERLDDLERAAAPLLSAGHVLAVERFEASGVLAVTGDATALDLMAAAPGVAEVRANRVRRLALPAGPRPETWGWNLAMIGAPSAWSRLGTTGEGVVVASIDSGVDWRHPALEPRYRGRAGDHDYNWLDVTAAAARRPVDDLWHGTHTMGLMVGRDGPKAYGVAPGAEWIAVRAFDGRGVTTDRRLLRAAEWIVAPTDLDGRAPRPDLAPDIVNCSWSLENGSDPLFEPVIRAWRAAGILPVFAVGNAEAGEPVAGAVLAPASDPGVLAVGAVDATGRAWAGSRAGPGFHGGVKPDLVAPGASVRSAWPGGGEGTGWGTSMAAPHVAGAAAIVRSANPALGVDDVADVLRRAARDRGTEGPDDVFGHGLLDVRAAGHDALAAGWVAGRVTAAGGAPVIGAEVRLDPASGAPRKTRSDGDGHYGALAGTGEWSLRVAALGFEEAATAVSVDPGRTSLVDIVLAPSPRATVSGTVTTPEGRPVAGALVGVVDDWRDGPEGVARQAASDPAGRFTLSLPAGRHDLRFAAPGRRTVTATLEVVPGIDLRHDAVLPAVPSVLLVDADAWSEERIQAYLGRALTDAGYAHDVWTVDTPAGVPTLTDLMGWDLVLWAHRGGSPGTLDRARGDTAVTTALERYVAAGGRLLVTGQDVGWRDAGDGPAPRPAAPEFYRHVLGARFVADRAGSTTVTGEGAFEGIRLDLAWPMGRWRGHDLRPDVVAPAADVAGIEWLLSYGDGGAAGLGVVDDWGRRAYLAFAPESAGPRAALALLVDRAIAWLEPPSLVLTTGGGALPAGGSTRVTATLRAGRVAGSAAVTVTLPSALVVDAPLVGGLSDLGGGRLAWSGTLEPDAARRLAFGTRLAGPAPGGRPLPIAVRLVAAARVVTATAQLVPATPDLAASVLSVTPGRLRGAGPVTTVLRLANDGPVAANVAVATLTLPPAMTPMSSTLQADAGSVAWGPGGRTATWHGAVTAGRGVTITLAGRLPAGVARQHTVHATADDGLGGVVARTAGVLVGGADLATSTLAPLPDHVAVGQLLQIALKVVNTGSVTATAEARVKVPPGLVPAAAEPVDPRTGEPFWRGEVAPGASVTPTLALEVTPDATDGPRTLEISLGDGMAPPAPLRWSAPLDVRRPDLSASRSVLLPSGARSGGPVTATVLLGNLGRTPAKVDVLDFLPPVLVVDAPSVRSSAGSTDAGIGVVRWSVELPAARRELDWAPDSGRIDLTGLGAVGPRDPRTGFRGPVQLGLAFPFHTAVYTQAWVADGGLLSFVPTLHDLAAADELPVATLAPLWQRGGGPAPAPRIRRAADRVTIAWPATPGGGLAVELGADGAIRFVYGPDVVTLGAVVGLRTPDGRRLSIPAADVPVGGAIRIGTPGSWAWLRFRSRLAAVAPNAVVTHSVLLSSLTGEQTLEAGLRANRLRLDGSTLEATPRTRSVGATVHFTLTVAAAGQVGARRVDVGIDLPDGLDLRPGLTGGLVMVGPGQDLEWHGPLAAGERRVLTWSARLRDELVAGAYLRTRATVRTAGVAPVALSATTAVVRTDFSGSEKRVSRAVAVPGQVVGVTLRVVNSGGEPTWVELLDAMPPELEYEGGATVSHGAPPAWDARSRTLRWTGELPPLSSTRIGFLARYAGPGPATNVMRLSDGQGTHFAAWAEVQPAAAVVLLPHVLR